MRRSIYFSDMRLRIMNDAGRFSTLLINNMIKLKKIVILQQKIIFIIKKAITCSHYPKGSLFMVEGVPNLLPSLRLTTSKKTQSQKYIQNSSKLNIKVGPIEISTFVKLKCDSSLKLNLNMLLIKACQISQTSKLKCERNHYKLMLALKYKRQLRWLLFLLIPFIAMLAIHILIPLQIITHSHPLIGQNHTYNNIKLSFRVLQSIIIVNSNTIEDVFRKYTTPFIQLYSINFSQKAFITFNNTTTLNSGNLFMQSILNKSVSFDTIINESMWFSANHTQYSQLSYEIQEAFNSYSSKQLFLRQIARISTFNPIQTLLTFYMVSNQYILFQYPTKYQPDYMNLTLDSSTMLFSSIVDELQSSSMQQISRAFAKYDSVHNESILMVCDGSKRDKLTMVTCQEVNLAILFTEIRGLLSIGNAPSISRSYLLVNVQLDSITDDPQILYSLDSNIAEQIPINSSLNTSSLNLPDDFFRIKNNSDGTIDIFFNNESIIYRSLISIGESSSLSLLFMRESQTTEIASSPIKSQQSINILVAPIIALVVLDCLISAIVVKILLDSIDEQLYELQHRCQFIVDGDITIEIPEYQGTENIRVLYEQVKIINRLHRYTVSEYFSGHFAEKVLKYNECLQFIVNIGYDTGNILENIGEAYVHVQQWEQSITSLKKSVELGLRQLKETFDLTLNQAFQLKIEKQPLPHGYKQIQLILTRRLFKLTFSYVKYVQFRQLASKTVSKVEEESFTQKVEAIIKQWTSYLRLLKQAFYPDNSLYSQSIVSLIYEAKQYANLKDYDECFQLLHSTIKCYKFYVQNYPEVTKMLKEKGSKFKLLHRKNKLTAHSRTSPDILKCILYMTINKVNLLYLTDPEKYNEAMKLYIEGLKGSNCTLSIYYLFMIDIRKLLIELRIDPTHFESTQIFKQGVPFKTLYYGEFTKQIQPHLLKFPTKASPGLERQYVFLIDCAKSYNRKERKYIDFHAERAKYIFNKHMKKTDRLSIIKFNAKGGIIIECKLTLKEFNNTILEKQIGDSFRESNQGRGSFTEIVEAFYIAINRVKSLQSEKIIVIYLKNLDYYTQEADRVLKRKGKSKKSLQKVEGILSQQEECNPSDFGEQIIDAMRVQGLRNCKVIFYCAMDDSIESFREFLGLEQINKRISGKYNSDNNVVYIIEDKHKADIDRILMLKAQEPADNHVFIL